MEKQPTTGTPGGPKGRVSLGFSDLFASVGDHIGHFYQAGGEEVAVLISFLQTGLEAGEKCVCLISDGSKRQDLQQALTAAGIDLESAVKSGQLFVGAGMSEPQQLRDMLGEILAQIPGRYPMLRWAGVMSWALKKIATTEKLMEWETHCNVVKNPPAVFLCQYELNTFPGTVVMDALQTHPISIISKAIHQNQYFQSPEKFLEELGRRDSTALAG